MAHTKMRTSFCSWPRTGLPALLATLFTMAVQPALAEDEDEFSMRIHRGIAKSESGTLVFGSVKTGAVNIGDTICVPLTTGELVPREVVGISMFSTVKKRAEAGNTVGLLVVDLKPGLIAKKATLYKDCERSRLESEAAAEAAESASKQTLEDASKSVNQPPGLSSNTDYSIQIHDAFVITDRGTVVFGLVKSGTVTVGDTACVPMTNGEVVPRTITAIERFSKTLERAEAGQTAGLLISKLDPKQVDKGQILHGNCGLSE